MDPILVPAPPASAYNPLRRVSDLLLSQLKLFQHVETKHGKLAIDPKLASDIHTEAGAAAYIAAVTTALRGSKLASKAKLVALPAKPKSKKPKPAPSLDLAAAAATPAKKRAASAKKSAKKVEKRKS